MRHIALAWFEFSVVLAVAQSPFEFADQRTHEVTYRGCARAGNVWVVGGGAGDAGGGIMGYFVQGIGADGVPVWNIPGPMIPFDMRSMPGGRALIAGPVDWCDVLAPTSVMTLVDPTGTVIWNKEYYVEWATRVDVADDGKMLLSANHVDLITDENGDSLTSFVLDTLGWPSPQWSVWDSDSTVMLLRYGGLLERRSLDAQVLASNDVGNGQDVIHWSGHRLVLQETGELQVLDEELTVLSTIALGAPFMQGRFVHGSSTLWAIGNETAVELDTALNILQSVILDPDGTFADPCFRGFAVDGDTIAMAGAESTAQSPAGIFRTVLMDGSAAVHDEDVSIALVSIDSAWCSNSSSMGYPRANVTVQVTNEGSGIVDSLVVSHTSFGWMCASVGTYLHLNDLNLATGASVIVELDSLWLDDTPCGWLNLDHEVCIAALSPNALYDRDGSDNLACDTAHIVLGLEEPTTAPPFVLVQVGGVLELRFFSPTTSSLQLNLVDASGRSLAEALIPRGTTIHRIPSTGLASGVHLVRVCDAGRGCWTVKWVKE